MKQRTRSLAILYTALTLTVAAIAVAIAIQSVALGWNNWAGAVIVAVCLAGLVWRVHSDPPGAENFSQEKT